MQELTPIGGILLLSFLAEGLVEYIARPIIHWRGREGEEPEPSPLWLRYVAMVVGIGLAIGYRADLLGLVGLDAVSPWVGYVITGIMVGRGSNYLNDLVDRWLARVR